jgi:hypothetical protein
MYLYKKQHWRILWSKKWWNFELYRTSHWIQNTLLNQEQGRKRMRNTPQILDTFEIIYGGKIVGKGIITGGFADRIWEHECNIGNSPHRNSHSLAELNITELLPYNSAPLCENWSQRQTWRQYNV